MKYEEAVKVVKSYYSHFTWPGIFTRIRFFTAPYKHLEQYVSRSGLVIDLGCGYGTFSNILGLISSERHILALELDDTKFKNSDLGIENVEFKNIDITKADVPVADCILLIHVLHHLNSYDDQLLLLKSCESKLKTGGRLVVCEVDRKPMWKYMLAQIADHLLYPGDKIYYRFPDNMLPILRSQFSNVEFIRSHYGTPFSHVTYVCTK